MIDNVSTKKGSWLIQIQQTTLYNDIAYERHIGCAVIRAVYVHTLARNALFYVVLCGLFGVVYNT